MLKIVLVLLAISTVATQQRQCPKYCEACDPIYKCHACLKSKVVNGRCDATQNTGNCLIFGQVGCEICTPGYSVLAYRSDGNKYCVRNTIQNCKISSDFLTGASQSLSQKKTIQRCTACLGGYPTKDLSACGTFSGEEDSGLEQQVNHCLWGGRPYQGAGTFCYRCKPGYATNSRTGKCVKSALPGCLFVSGPQNCDACNPYEGFYQKTLTACTK